MKFSGVAQKYAQALFDLSVETKNEVLILDWVTQLNFELSKDSKLIHFLSNPLFSEDEKEKIFLQVFEKKAVPEIIRNFILLLIHKKRLSFLLEIFTAYQSISETNKGLVRGQLKAAAPLTKAQQEEITQILSQKLKQSVVLDYNEDPQLLGGFVVQVGNQIYDNSLFTQLNKLQDQLNRRAL